jgi:hypothetical protein
MHLCILRGSQNKQWLFLFTALTYRFYNRGRECLLRGTKWVLKSDSYSFVLIGYCRQVYVTASNTSRRAKNISNKSDMIHFYQNLWICWLSLKSSNYMIYTYHQDSHSFLSASLAWLTKYLPDRIVFGIKAAEKHETHMLCLLCNSYRCWDN